MSCFILFNDRGVLADVCLATARALVIRKRAKAGDRRSIRTAGRRPAAVVVT